MFVFVVANFLVIPLAIFAHPHAGPVLHGIFVTPGVARRVQLHLGPAHHRHRRHDRGPVAAVLPAVQHRRQADHAPLDQLRARRHRPRLVHHRPGRQPDHRHRRLRLRPHPRRPGTSPTPAAWPTPSTATSATRTGTLFAIILLNASIIGAAAVTLSTSYAFGDIFGTRHSLNRRVRRRQVLLRHLHGHRALAAGASSSSPEPRSGSSPPRCRPWPGSCCRAPRSSCCCCATTRPCSGPGSTGRG